MMNRGNRKDQNKDVIRKNLAFLAGVLCLFQASICCSQGEADMDPVEVLRKEHKIIRKVAAAAERTAEKIENHPLDVDLKQVDKLHDFFTNFADRCHHAKEEDELFPVLQKELDDTMVLELLKKQHEEGRILLSGIRGQWSALANEEKMASLEALTRYLYEYAQLMYRHIDLENEYLWPLASAGLDDGQKKELARAFYRIEVQELGKGFHEKYHSLAMDILGKEAE